MREERVDSLDRQIGRMRSQLSSIERERRAEGAPEGRTESSEDLRMAIEELYVAEEELRLQHEELLGVRAELEDQRRGYEELFQLAPDAYLVTNPLGIVREANRAAAELLGIESQFLIGKPLATYVDADDPRRPACPGQRLRLLRTRGRLVDPPRGQNRRGDRRVALRLGGPRRPQRAGGHSLDRPRHDCARPQRAGAARARRQAPGDPRGRPRRHRPARSRRERRLRKSRGGAAAGAIRRRVARTPADRRVRGGTERGPSGRGQPRPPRTGPSRGCGPAPANGSSRRPPGGGASR